MSNHLIFQPLGTPVPGGRGLERVADIDPRLTRTHYFDGRLLTAEDLTRDQIYLDQRLREVGQTLGSGIMRGLELSFDGTAAEMRLSPGVGISAAGRVLELGRELTVDLGDRSLIAALNQGRNRRFDRGLYAVVLRYAEVGSDIAEVFPRDLGEQRGFQFDVISEAVQLGLVPLPQPLPEQNWLHVRANLIREFLGDGQAAGLVPEDAVALGVLAIREDRPIWLDTHLLRHPLRASPTPGDLQADLSRHYEALFQDVLSYRRAGSLGGDFAASEYFRLLPPAGSLPKEAVDPVGGRQGFFPESYRVWVAPIRLSDLALIRKESMQLPPIDPALDEPVDVVVLAPLPNQDYGFYARRLERAYDPALRRLPHLDLLRLRLYPRRPVHELDTDAATWQSIWDRVPEESLLYIRRPTRAAETAISGIVLARGTELPGPPTTTEPTPSDGDALVQDEDSVFLNRINFQGLAVQRPADEGDAANALTDLSTEFGSDATVVQQCLNVLLRVEHRYDGVVWQTVLALARSENLLGFHEALLESHNEFATTGQLVLELGSGLGLAAELLDQWAAVDAA